tara:strand:- start:7004 stop:8053 length:1050 start_codon:yes stop_codon:yes gene_type:complete
MKKILFASFIGLSFIGTSCATLTKNQVSRLDIIKERGEIKCGVSGQIPGFSFLKSNGSYSGIDVEICKAIAAAIFGDMNKVQYRRLTAPERFTALKTGEIDVLSRNTTLNLTRDSAKGNGATFAPVVFHDGQGLMVKKESGVKLISQLKNSNICVGSGTTTEQNINDIFQERNIPYTPIKYQDLNQVVTGYLQGRCSAMTSDKSQLAAARSGFKKPEDHIILDETLSKEPLAPASVGGDQRLSDAIRWIIYALFTAEELNITKGNIDSKFKLAKENSNLLQLRRLFGIEGNLGDKLGLPNDFVVSIIRSTGNYKEIYDRHLGEKSAVPIPRGLNRSYKDGGLQIAPPFK